MLRMQRAQPPYGTFATPNARRLTRMQSWMPLGNEPELRGRTSEIEQCFDVRFHVEEIDLRRFDTPLLRQRRTRDDGGNHFGFSAVGAGIAATDFEQTRARLLATLVAAECLQQTGPERGPHHCELSRDWIREREC